MRIFLILIFLCHATVLQAGFQADTPPEMEDWPARIISFAYSWRQDSAILNKLRTGESLPGRDGAQLLSDYVELYKIFGQNSGRSRPDLDLPFIGHYCWFRLHPGFSCGDPSKREYTDSGFLYVSDFVPSDKPFLILILSTPAPRRTAIYRLFQDQLDELYFRGDHEDNKCGLSNSDGPLFATYGLDVSTQGQIILTETEGFHWDMLPRRTYSLEVTADSCSLTLLTIDGKKVE